MYKGYIEVKPTEEEWAKLYEQPNENIFNCLDNQYLIEQGTVALYSSNGTKISHIVLDQGTMQAAAKVPVRLSVPINSTELTDGDRLYLQFTDVVFNGAAFTIPVQASITYTK